MNGETEKVRCDIDDIMCQIEALNHLKGLQNVMGDEKFRSSFPELEGLGEKLTEKIQGQRESLQEALERCGLPVLEEVEPSAEVKTGTDVLTSDVLTRTEGAG